MSSFGPKIQFYITPLTDIFNSKCSVTLGSKNQIHFKVNFLKVEFSDKNKDLEQCESISKR